MNAQLIKKIVDEMFRLLEIKLSNRFLLLMGLHAIQSMADSFIDQIANDLISKKKLTAGSILDANVIKLVIEELFNYIEAKLKGKFILLLVINAIQTLAENLVDQILVNVPKI